MNEPSEYSLDDIEKFLEINRVEHTQNQNSNIQKLLSVQNKIAIFKDINPVELKAIIYNLKFIKYHLGDYIIKQNDSSQEMFFIITGKCEVLHNTTKIATLKAGDIFGESAAIFKTKRNASLACSSSETTLLSFCIDDDNLDFCASALATLYKNLAFEINAKLQDINYEYIKNCQKSTL